MEHNISVGKRMVDTFDKRDLQKPTRKLEMDSPAHYAVKAGYSVEMAKQNYERRARA